VMLYIHRLFEDYVVAVRVCSHRLVLEGRRIFKIVYL